MKSELNANVEINLNAGVNSNVNTRLESIEKFKVKLGNLANNQINGEIADQNIAHSQQIELEQKQRDQNINVNNHIQIELVQQNQEEGIMVDTQVEKVSQSAEAPKPQEETKTASFFKLEYFLASPCDIFTVLLATLLSMGSGGAMPAFMLIFGDMINNFSVKSSSVTPLQVQKMVENITNTCVTFVYLGIALFCINALNMILWSSNGQKVARSIKNEYFKAIMRQEQNWFDQYKNKFEFATKVESQTKTIELGLGTKIGNFIMGVTSFCGKI